MRCLESLARFQAARLLFWQAVGRRERRARLRGHRDGDVGGGHTEPSSPAPGGEGYLERLCVPTVSLTPPHTHTEVTGLRLPAQS